MYCRKCGNKVDGMSFCATCGAPVVSPDSAPAPQSSAISTESIPLKHIVSVGKNGNAKKISVLAVVIVIIGLAILGALFALGVISFDTPIDEEHFPNDVIRNAVVSQVDKDGNGRLSNEESSAIISIVYTDNGVTFLSDNDAVDIDISDLLKNQAQTDTSRLEGSSSETVMPDMDIFPNMKTVVIRNTNIQEFNVATVPNAEYIDIRDNEISSLDLSQNSNISTLLCDPATHLTGLEEAGLYYTDLITNIEKDDTDSSTSVEYDLFGRPITLTEYGNTYNFSYDEKDRLTKISFNGHSKHDTTYEYATNGLLASYSFVPSTDVTETRVTYKFGYDENGELTQIDDCALLYEDGRLTASKKINDVKSSSNVSFSEYRYDENGNILNTYAGITPNANNIHDSNYELGFDAYGSQFTFNDQGQVISISNEVDLTRCAVPNYETEFTMNPDGSPLKTTVSSTYDGGSPNIHSQTYTCNSDGYITSIKQKTPYSSERNETKITYIKMVGSLIDRPSRRFIPVLRTSIVHWAVASESRSVIQPLQSSDCLRHDWWPFDDILMQPQCVLLDHLGIVPNYLANANELKLAAYDQEHWKDDLDLSVGALPIQDETIQTSISTAISTQIPVNPTAFLNDNDYKSIIDEYMSFARYLGGMSKSSRERVFDYKNVDNLYAKYPNISRDFLMASSISEEESFNFAFAYIDLDEDGNNELLIGVCQGDTPSTIQAIYTIVNGSPKLIAESMYRDQFWLSTNKCLINSGSGGFDVRKLAVYQLNKSKLKQVGLFEYEFVDGKDRGGTNSPYKLSFQIDGGKIKKSIVRYSELEKYEAKLKKAYPMGTCQWTCIW